MGYIKRIGDKKYRIVYDLPRGKDGMRRQKTETIVGKSKPEAEAHLMRRKQQIANLQPIVDETLTVDELYERFIVEKRASLALTTLERYGELYRVYLGPAFGQLRASTLRQGYLAEVYSKWAESGRDGKEVSGRTIRHSHELLRNVLGWGVRRDLVVRNIASLLRGDDLPRTSRPEPRALTKAGVKAVLWMARNATSRARKRNSLSAQPWFYPAVAASTFTGARRGEVLALRWSDVDLVAKTATIRRSLSQTKQDGLTYKEPKNGKARTINVSDTLVSILVEHKEVQAQERAALGAAYRDENLIFSLATGGPVRPWNYGAAVRDLLERADAAGMTLHDLRDTHASLLAANGVPLEVVSRRLGHANIAVTAERYLHVYRDRDASAAGTFEQIMT
jgi:integrase